MSKSMTNSLVCFLTLATIGLGVPEFAGVEFGANNMTKLLTTPYWTAYHFEREQNIVSSRRNVIFSSHGRIEISAGLEESSLKNKKIIINHTSLKDISGFCQNGTHIIMVDHNNHCIRSVQHPTESDDRSLKTVVGSCGQAGFKDGNKSIARLHEPQNIYRVEQENQSLYLITDRNNNAIRIFSGGNYELSTFVSDSINLPEPIDLIISGDELYLYVTVKTGLVKVEITSRQITAISLSETLRLYKIIALTQNVYLMTAMSKGKLILVDINNGTLKSKSICTGQQTSKVGNITECALNRPYSLFWDNYTSSIIVGSYQYIRQVKVTLTDDRPDVTQLPFQWPTSNVSSTSTTTTTATLPAHPPTLSTSSAPTAEPGGQIWNELNQTTIIYAVLGFLTLFIAVLLILVLRLYNNVRKSSVELRMRTPSRRLPRPPRMAIPSHTTTIDPYGCEDVISSCHSSSRAQTMSSHADSPLIAARNAAHRVNTEYTPMGRRDYSNHRFHNSQHAVTGEIM